MVPSRTGIALSLACAFVASVGFAAPTQAADLDEIKSEQSQVQSSLKSTTQALGKANTKLQKAVNAAATAQRSLVQAKILKKAALRESKKAAAVLPIRPALTPNTRRARSSWAPAHSRGSTAN